MPAGIAVVGVVVLTAVMWRAAEESAGLRRDVARLLEIRSALGEVRGLAADTTAAAHRLRRSPRPRRRPLTPAG